MPSGHPGRRVLEHHAAGGLGPQLLGGDQEDLQIRLAPGHHVAADHAVEVPAQADRVQAGLDPRHPRRRRHRERQPARGQPVEQVGRTRGGGRVLPVLGQHVPVEAAQVVLVRLAQTAHRVQVMPQVFVGRAEVAGVLRHRQRRLAVFGQHRVDRVVVQRLGVEQDPVQVEDHRLRVEPRLVRRRPGRGGAGHMPGGHMPPPPVTANGLASVSLPATSLGSWVSSGGSSA